MTDIVREDESLAANLDSNAHHANKHVLLGSPQPALKEQSSTVQDTAVDTSNDQPSAVTAPVPNANSANDLDAQIRALFFPAMVTFSLDPLLGAVDTGMGDVGEVYSVRS